MKYVAFLDILGFKEKLRALTHEGAIKFIGSFSEVVFRIFQEINSKLVIGYIVSDSIVLYTNDASQESLIEIVKMVKKICREEFSENGILIRGAIAKGNFDRIPAMELPKLQKQLIVGEAYVEAYLLEDKLKYIGINLTKAVYEDMKNQDEIVDVIETQNNNVDYYVLRYITLDFLLDVKNMIKFVGLAKDSKWRPHYYNAVYLALEREKRIKEVEQLFVNIENLVCDNKPNENWRDLDEYIENVFDENVNNNFKTRFLKHIRNKLFL